VDKEYDNKLIGLYMGVSLFITIPTTFLLTNYLSRKLKDRRIIIILLSLSVLFNLLMLCIFEASIIKFVAMSCACLITGNLLENTASLMFAKIIPGNFEIGRLNAGLIINYSTTIGRMLGALCIFFLSWFEYYEMEIIIYSITSGLYFILLIFCLVFYKDMRVKAIARILRNRSIRKHKAIDI
jgi:hypothetical protein